MPNFDPNLYPFVFDAQAGLAADEVSHIWDSTLPDVLALLSGSNRFEAPFEQATKVEVPIVLIQHPLRVDGLSKLTFRLIEKGGKKIYLARLQCFGKDDAIHPYLELDSKSDCAELALRHLTYSFASYIFAILGEMESVG